MRNRYILDTAYRFSRPSLSPRSRSSLSVRGVPKSARMIHDALFRAQKDRIGEAARAGRDTESRFDYGLASSPPPRRRDCAKLSPLLDGVRSIMRRASPATYPHCARRARASSPSQCLARGRGAGKRSSGAAGRAGDHRDQRKGGRGSRAWRTRAKGGRGEREKEREMIATRRRSGE